MPANKNPVSVMTGAAFDPSTPAGSGQAKDKGKGNSASGADQQTQANRVNQNTPFGNQQWTHNPDGTWTQNTSLNPGMQSALDSSTRQMQDAWSKPMDDGSQARDQAINSAYGQATSRLNPQWDMRSHQLESQLANQGLDPSSEAARNANAQFGRDRNDAYSSAMNGAIGMGTQAQATTFAQNLAARNAPLQQLQGLHGLMAMPGYNTAGDYMQQQMLERQMTVDALRGGGQLAQSIQGMAQPNPTQQTGGYGGYVNPAGYDDQGWGNYPGSYSDERLKQNVQRLPIEAAPGVPAALFEYKAAPGQKHLGVIAQDLERVAPEHVQEDANGIKMVSPQFAPFSFAKKR
jgi:hypothetical protein